MFALVDKDAEVSLLVLLFLYTFFTKKGELSKFVLIFTPFT